MMGSRKRAGPLAGKAARPGDRSGGPPPPPRKNLPLLVLSIALLAAWFVYLCYVALTVLL